MSLFDRTSRVVRANLSSSQHSSTPVHCGSQSANDAKASLIQMCQSVSQILAMQWNTQQQIDKAQFNVTTCQQQAQAALDRADERSARQALIREREQSLSLASLENKLKEQTSLLELLQSRLTALEEKFPKEAQQVEAEFKSHFWDNVDAELETIGHQRPCGGLFPKETAIDAELEALKLELDDLNEF